MSMDSLGAGDEGAAWTGLNGRGTAGMCGTQESHGGGGRQNISQIPCGFEDGHVEILLKLHDDRLNERARWGPKLDVTRRDFLLVRMMT